MKTLRPTPWNLIGLSGETLRNPQALSDVTPLLNRLIEAFGQNSTARLLDVSSGTITNWRGRRKMEPEYAKRILDLHDVLSRALQVFQPATAMSWLCGSEPFLGHKRPIDILALEGAAPVIEALDAIDAGAYA
jgi:putative toxin-antitoxin system antitoxin component (TIGR02293 family)